MRKKQVEDFIKRLEGKEGCNFHTNSHKEVRWTCAGDNDQSLSKKILKKMNIPDGEAEEFLKKASSYGGYCDCEIIFNATEKLLNDAIIQNHNRLRKIKAKQVIRRNEYANP